MIYWLIIILIDPLRLCWVRFCHIKNAVELDYIIHFTTLIFNAKILPIIKAEVVGLLPFAVILLLLNFM